MCYSDKNTEVLKLNPTWAKQLKIAVLAAVFSLSMGSQTMGLAASNLELQTEYLQHRFFGKRYIDDYNVHVFQKAHEQGGVTIHRGLTITRAHGYTTEDDIRRDSNAVGLGPAMMLRWERPLSGKMYWDLEGSVSFLAYHKAFPAQGRPWGFMWRIGPRFTYKYTSHNSISLGYMMSHHSNGMKTKNPGHNAIGFSLGLNHTF